MLVELDKQEISLILVALDWYELSLSKGEIEQSDDRPALKTRIDNVTSKLLRLFWGRETRGGYLI